MLRYRTVHQMIVAMPQGTLGSADLWQLQRFERETRAMVELSRFNRLVIDLSELRYFGAGFLGVIARLAEVTKQHQGKIALCGALPDCLDILQRAGVDRTLPIYPDVRVAARAMA